MKRTVESGKTLLVDGPASVSVVSGIVEVFGSVLRSVKQVVVRDGKRVPFFVKETAIFGISLGENANVEEIDGDTIPSSWVKAFEELLNPHIRPFTVMVLGTVDSGKTSFCTFLINKLLNERKKVAILDGDVGQSEVGPPCTISYALVTKPVMNLYDLQARNAFFVGSTSPSESVDKMIEGSALLKQKVLADDPDSIIVNTDGWVEGDDAVTYKIQLVERLSPDIVFCMQQKDELASLLDALKKFRKVVVESPVAAKQRSGEKRRSSRELGYMKYLNGAKIRSIPLSWLKIEEDKLIGLCGNRRNIKQTTEIYRLIGMKPLNLAEFRDRIYMVIGKRRWINLDNVKKIEEATKKKVVVIHKGEEEGLLLALYDAEKSFLGIGSLREIDYKRRIMKIYTPVSENISIVAVGRVKLDENLKETTVSTEANQ